MVQYTAVITAEGGTRVVAFPGLPGCQTQATSNEPLLATAQEALAVWLEAHLAHGEAPPRPMMVPSLPPEARAEYVAVAIPMRLATALQVRWAREDTTLSRETFAARRGVDPLTISRLESPEEGLSDEDLAVADAALRLPARPTSYF